MTAVDGTSRESEIAMKGGCGAQQSFDQLLNLRVVEPAESGNERAGIQRVAIGRVEKCL